MAESPVFDAVGIGTLNVDHVHTVSRVTVEGLERVQGTTVDAGGCSANAAYALARLGLRCGFLGVVGDDKAADVVVDSFRSAGVDTTGVARRVDQPTGRAIILSDAEGRRAMYLEPGANGTYMAADIPPGYLLRTRLVIVSSFEGAIAADVQRTLVDSATEDTVLAFILDALVAGRRINDMAPLLSRCNVIFGNEEEVFALTDGDGPKRLLDAGCRNVVVTFGASEEGEACRIHSRDGEQSVAARRALDGPIVDATGAGDAFAAGYLWGLLAGWAPMRCGALGHTLAGFVVGAPGCRDGTPTRDRLLARHRRIFGE
jgi:ribokinase